MCASPVSTTGLLTPAMPRRSWFRSAAYPSQESRLTSRPGPYLRSFWVITICWPTRFHWAGESRRPSHEPLVLALAEQRARAVETVVAAARTPSSHAWTSRNWRVSSRWKRASGPHETRRLIVIEAPFGTLALRSGMFS